MSDNQQADATPRRVVVEEYSMAKLIALVALVLGLFFLFWGSPDVWDKLHERAIAGLNVNCPAASLAEDHPK